jgi:hypothetical protein
LKISSQVAHWNVRQQQVGCDEPQRAAAQDDHRNSTQQEQHANTDCQLPMVAGRELGGKEGTDESTKRVSQPRKQEIQWRKQLHALAESVHCGNVSAFGKWNHRHSDIDQCHVDHAANEKADDYRQGVSYDGFHDQRGSREKMSVALG